MRFDSHLGRAKILKGNMLRFLYNVQQLKNSVVVGDFTNEKWYVSEMVEFISTQYKESFKRVPPHTFLRNAIFDYFLL